MDQLDLEPLDELCSRLERSSGNTSDEIPQWNDFQATSIPSIDEGFTDGLVMFVLLFS